MKRRFRVLAVALLGLVGCMQPQQARLQSEEDLERDKETAVQVIGDVTAVANAGPTNLSGVGLVTGLAGTGGSPPPGSDFRRMLENDLQKRGVEGINEILASPNNAVVLVSARLPAGAQHNDPIDVEITLPPQSRVTSLRGGVLLECHLFNYSSTQQLTPGTGGPNRALLGHPLAKAQGTLLVGFGDGDESAQVRQARIWGGGRAQVERPLMLSLNANQQFARISMRVAERINETMQGPYHGPSSTLAEAKTKEVVNLRVPAQYRHNLARYLRVVRFIPLQEAPPPNSPYRRKLEEDLLDPARTVTAALRLEALGSETQPVFRKGLKSPHALVRFACAEALAYLGSPSCGEELGKLAAEEPMLRAYCLTALASLKDEAICDIQLRELMNSNSPETRYGAFRALRAMDERASGVDGQHLNQSFWLHRVAQGSAPLVHISTSQRAEIVLFGDDPCLEAPFSFLAGPEFTVTATEGDEQVTVSRFSKTQGTKRKQCSMKVADVLRAVGELGGTYPDAVELVRQAEKNKCLSCPVAADALPEAPSVQMLARDGLGEASKTTDPDILNARSEFGVTPTLFQAGPPKKPARPAAE